MLNNLALIPARGGSKSIPLKNIVSLGGRPLLTYTLQAVCKSRYVNRVIVDTDHPEIAAVATQNGAEVPYLRPQALAQDDTPTMPVLRHSLDWLEKTESYVPDYVLLVEATRPFIKTEDIDRGFDLILRRPDADSLTTVIEVPNRFHPYRIRFIDEEGWLTFALPEERMRYPTRQSLPKRYAIGSLWIMKPEVIRKSNIPIGDRCLPLIIEDLTSFDIDSLEDLKIAEQLLPLIFPG